MDFLFSSVQLHYAINLRKIDFLDKIMYYTNKLKGKPLQMMGYKVTGSKRCKPQDSLTARLNRI